MKIISLLCAAWAAQVAGRVLSADFDWQVLPLDGYPAIAFDQASETKEVVFKYNFTGVIGPYKLLTSKLLDKNCNESADSSLAIMQNVSGNQMEIDLDIVQDRIAQSRQYSENAEGTRAVIDFCLRVDYNYIDSVTNELQSITFHETSVEISVDLTANFTLDGISTNRTASSEDQANTALDYPVEAYFCNDLGEELGQPALKQGSALQFCVRTPANLTADVFVDNVLEFTISQPGALSPPVKPIENGQPDGLTNIGCELGVCNVKHQLSSTWFALPLPPTSAPTRAPTVAPAPGSGSGLLVPPTFSQIPSSMPSSMPSSAPSLAPVGGGGAGGGGPFVPPPPTSMPTGSGGGANGGTGGATGGGPGGGEFFPPGGWSMTPSAQPSTVPSLSPSISAMPSSMPSARPTQPPVSFPAGERQLGGFVPKPLKVDGVAVLALGVATASPTAAPQVRRLAIPIRGLLRVEPPTEGSAIQSATSPNGGRQLADSDRPFELTVPLVVTDDAAGAEVPAGGSRRPLVIMTMLMLFVLVLCCVAYALCTRRNRRIQEEVHLKSAAVSTQFSDDGPDKYGPPIYLMD